MLKNATFLAYSKPIPEHSQTFSHVVLIWMWVFNKAEINTSLIATTNSVKIKRNNMVKQKVIYWKQNVAITEIPFILHLHLHETINYFTLIMYYYPMHDHTYHLFI